MRITESRLRQIIREERQKMGIRGLREGGELPSTAFYSKKARFVRGALMALKEVQTLEQREGLGEDDPDLVPIIDALSGYLSAVEAMTQYE